MQQSRLAQSAIHSAIFLGWSNELRGARAIAPAWCEAFLHDWFESHEPSLQEKVAARSRASSGLRDDSACSIHVQAGQCERMQQILVGSMLPALFYNRCSDAFRADSIFPWIFHPSRSFPGPRGRPARLKYSCPRHARQIGKIPTSCKKFLNHMTDMPAQLFQTTVGACLTGLV